MRGFIIVLFAFIGVLFFNANLNYNTAYIENDNSYVVISDSFNDNIISSPDYFISSKNIYNNDSFEIFNFYNFFVRLCDKYNRINDLISQQKNHFHKKNNKDFFYNKTFMLKKSFRNI
jgi:hypothetical protein